ALAPRWLVPYRASSVVHLLARLFAVQRFDERPRPLAPVHFRKVRPQFLCVLVICPAARDVQPNHAKRIGWEKSDRSGEIIGGGSRTPGVELSKPAYPKRKGGIRIEAKCRGRVGYRAVHRAFGEIGQPA